MNDQHSNDRRQLEKATQRQPLSSGSGLADVNLLASRQAWLALGEAVEAAGREGLNQDALLASLQNELLKTPSESSSADAAPQVDWSWAVLGLVAVLLVAATIVGALSQRQEEVPGLHTIVQPEIVQPKTPVNGDSVPPGETPQPELTPEQSLVETGNSSWTDIDEDIQTTYAALQQLGQRPSDVDQSLTDFDTQLKRFSADIAEEPL
jgi:hypothetical protein